MAKKIEPWSYAWMVPTPLTPSEYTPVFPEHAQFNLVTDLKAIRRFDDGTNVADDQHVLWSDLQDYPGYEWAYRLGSGRCGVFRGKYLKGMGRTILCSNWNTEDEYHNSGHLFPSNALREFFVTAHLKSLGLENSVVPCEGLLFRKLDPALKGVAEQTWLYRKDRPADWKPEPIETALQAISIKPFDHVRFSNLFWQLHHLSFDEGKFHFFNFLENLTQYLARQLNFPNSASRIEPAQVVRLFCQTYERAVEHFTAFRRAGVFWASYGDNFTIDGRFLDLEMSSVVGTPKMVVLSGKLNAPTISFPQQGNLIGADVFEYAWAARVFGDYFMNTVNFFRTARIQFLSPLQRQYLDELVFEWKTQMKDCWVNQSNRILSVAEKVLTDGGNLGKLPRAVKSMIRHDYQLIFGKKTVSPMKGISLRRTAGYPPLTIEPLSVKGIFELPEWPLTHSEVETATLYQERLKKIYQITDVETLVREIRMEYNRMIVPEQETEKKVA